jgi:glycosyltransferase involved in cell wall biosynthesis/SAM-dependent methyltransferase
MNQPHAPIPMPPRDQTWAEGLLHRYRGIVGSLALGEASIVGQRVALVGQEADDYFLARLLAAQGAETVFLACSPIAWDAGRDVPGLLELGRTLDAENTPFDRMSLGVPRSGALPDTVPHFHCDAFNRTDLAEQYSERFDLVIGLGIVPDDGGLAPDIVRMLASLVRVGGELEIVETPTHPLSAATVCRLRAEAAPLALGVRAQASRRLSLIKLAGPLHEQPDEDSDNDVMVAHCRTRLEFVCGWVAGRDVLEAGCATGIGARMFAAAGARRVLGLELAEESLAQARAQTTSVRIDFQQANLDEPLPCADASFDVVVCTEVLEHIRKPQAAIDEFFRVLRPGGVLLISVPDLAIEEGWERVNRFGNPHHVHVPDDGTFSAMLRCFPSVQHFRQLDVVGSLVVEEGQTSTNGVFVTEGRGITPSVRSVRMAVCSKGAGVTLPRPPATLRVFRTFTDEQLRTHETVADRTRDLCLARREAFAARNSEARGGGDVAIEIWARLGAALACAEPPTPGPWLRRLLDVIQRVSPTDRPAIGKDASTWTAFVTPQNEPILLPMAGRARPGEVHTVIFPEPEDCISLEALWHWRRIGARFLWFADGENWLELDAEAAFVRRLFRKTWGALGKRLLPARFHGALQRAEAHAVHWAMTRRGGADCPHKILSPDGRPDPAPWERWIAQDNCSARDAAVPGGRSLRVLQYGGALYCGGAERQLCNLTIGLAQRGIDVRVRTTHPPVGALGHYTHLLQRQRIPIRAAGSGFPAPRPAADFPCELLASVPMRLHRGVLALAGEIADMRPDVLHGWLDEPNLIAAIAGLLAGVPRILLAVRNVNPTNFPRLFSPYMTEWYRLLAGSRRVHFLSNSRAGAESYAAWIGIPVDRFHIVPNGLSFEEFPARRPEAVRAARASFGLAATDRVVAGVFRLDEEKRPDAFLAVIREVFHKVPNVKVLLAGAGPLEDHVRRMLPEYGLHRCVQLLGRRVDVASVLLASDVLLLTSAHEGCPNAVIEAQYLGVPVVATRGGGTPEALLDGVTGLLADVDDVEHLARNLCRILDDEGLRSRFARNGETFARRRFDLDAMVDRTLLVYHRLFDSESRTIDDEVDGVTAEAEPMRSYLERSRTPPALLTPPPATRRPELTPAEMAWIESIEGHFHRYDAEAAHRLARLSCGPIVELGSYLGKSTAALLLGSARTRQRVIAVDPWFASDPDQLGYEHTRLHGVEDFLGFCRNVRRLRERLTVHGCRSRRLRWEGPAIGALFIDSIHRYDEVRADFEHFAPFLRPDALLAFHDYLPENPVFPGVKRFIEESLLRSGEWEWDDYRGAFLTLRRRRPSRRVVEHNWRVLEAARARYAELAGHAQAVAG